MSYKRLVIVAAEHSGFVVSDREGNALFAGTLDRCLTYTGDTLASAMPAAPAPPDEANNPLLKWTCLRCGALNAGCREAEYGSLKHAGT